MYSNSSFEKNWIILEEKHWDWLIQKMYTQSSATHSDKTISLWVLWLVIPNTVSLDWPGAHWHTVNVEFLIWVKQHIPSQEGGAIPLHATFHQCKEVTTARRQQWQVCVGRESRARAGHKLSLLWEAFLHLIGTPSGRLWAFVVCAIKKPRQFLSHCSGVACALCGLGGKKLPSPCMVLRRQDSEPSERFYLLGFETCPSLIRCNRGEPWGAALS
jgi:hypothetical protein